MNYRHALLISLLLHGLAFAGTTWVAALGNPKGQATNLLPLICVDVQWDSPSPCSKSCKPIIDNKKATDCLPQSPKKVSKVNKKTLTSVDSAVTETPIDLNANNVLIPCPDNSVPTYPEEARRQGLQGEMVLTLTINGAGSVIKIDVEKGNDMPPLLKEAAVETVKKWRFIRHDKASTLLSVTLPISFNLEE